MDTESDDDDFSTFRKKLQDFDEKNKAVSSSAASVISAASKILENFDYRKKIEYKDLNINNKLSDSALKAIQDSKGPLKPDKILQFLINDVLDRKNKNVLTLIRKYSNDIDGVQKQLLEILKITLNNIELRKNQDQLDKKFVKNIEKLNKVIQQENLKERDLNKRLINLKQSYKPGTTSLHLSDTKKQGTNNLYLRGIREQGKTSLHPPGISKQSTNSLHLLDTSKQSTTSLHLPYSSKQGSINLHRSGISKQSTTNLHPPGTSKQGTSKLHPTGTSKQGTTSLHLPSTSKQGKSSLQQPFGNRIKNANGGNGTILKKMENTERVKNELPVGEIKNIRKREFKSDNESCDSQESGLTEIATRFRKRVKINSSDENSQKSKCEDVEMESVSSQDAMSGIVEYDYQDIESIAKKFTQKQKPNSEESSSQDSEISSAGSVNNTDTSSSGSSLWLRKTRRQQRSVSGLSSEQPYSRFGRFYMHEKTIPERSFPPGMNIHFRK